MNVTGTAEIIAKLNELAGKMAENCVEAVERTNIAVANAAKRDHAKRSREAGITKKGKFRKGVTAGHFLGRYQNVTGNLTQSIAPEEIEVTKDAIIGKIGAGSNLEYAEIVERRFPFLFPALIGEERKFFERVRRAMTV